MFFSCTEGTRQLQVCSGTKWTEQEEKGAEGWYGWA